MESSTNVYLVIRPYCTPSKVVVIATSNEDAVNQVTKQFGYCSNTTATLKNERGIILARE